MKSPMQESIDESLSTVRFTEADRQRVLNMARRREEDALECPPLPPRRRKPWGVICAYTLAVLLLVPIPWMLRPDSVRTPSLSGTPTASATASPAASPVPTAVPGAVITEDQATAAARMCFESACDTTIFAFDEYALTTGYDVESRIYRVTLHSLYGNGCTFRVDVDAQTGEVRAHSAPRLATQPTALDAAQVQTWYDTYGAHLFAWPQHAQAEFSRRYEGALLREAAEGELTAAQAEALAAEAAAASMRTTGDALHCYAMLYSERANADGRARYVVTCLNAPPSEASGRCAVVTLDPQDGRVLDVSLTDIDKLGL